jgi:chorismate-pyruvate lyase
MQLSCHFSHLELSLRVLLTSDGTVTDMLTMCRERINAVKIAQELQPAERFVDPLELAPGESVLSRHVLVRGDRTGTNYVYAKPWTVQSHNFGGCHATAASADPLTDSVPPAQLRCTSLLPATA